MIISIIEATLFILLNFSGTHECYSSTENNCKRVALEKSLAKIDLSKDHILNAIFEEVLVEDDKQAKMYSVTINDYYDGSIVEIIRLNNDMVYGTVAWDGFALLNDRTFVIERVHSDYPLAYATPKQMQIFNCVNYSFNDPESTWFYYILEDNYAWFSPEHGWIWSDGKPDE